MAKRNATTTNTFPDPKSPAAPKPNEPALETAIAQAKVADADAVAADAPSKPEAADVIAARALLATVDSVSSGQAKKLAAIAEDSETYLGIGSRYTGAALAKGAPFPVNFKTAGTACYDRFSLHRQGETVAEYLAVAGLKDGRKDIAWELKRNMIGVLGKRAAYYLDMASRSR
jgi:hypothetical protein